MKSPLIVSIVSTSPIFARGIQKLLQREAQISTNCGAWDIVLDLPSAVPNPDVILLLPQNWEEFEGILPTVHELFALCPWLILADLRLVGMFLDALDDHPATVVAPDRAPHDLWETMWTLAEGNPPPVSAQLFACFDSGAAGSAHGQEAGRPSRAELPCACAVSLGLSNDQIAEVLHVSASTVKSHLHRLMRKYHLSTRQELAAVIHHALGPSRATWRGPYEVYWGPGPETNASRAG